jgi:hypothetical protein
MRIAAGYAAAPLTASGTGTPSPKCVPCVLLVDAEGAVACEDPVRFVAHVVDEQLSLPAEVGGSEAEPQVPEE